MRKVGGGALSDLYKSKNKDMVDNLELHFCYLYKTKSTVSQTHIFPDAVTQDAWFLLDSCCRRQAVNICK